MVDEFGEKLMHNQERNLRKSGLSMRAFKPSFKFVNVYTFVKVGCAHFDMCNFYTKLIDLDPQDTFFTILLQADFFIFSPWAKTSM